MKETTRPAMKPRGTTKMASPGKQGVIFRRASNHNAHIITPHGKIQSGRKGRKG